jgi:hypothetical protein
MVVTSTNNYFFYGITCAECNHRLPIGRSMGANIPSVMPGPAKVAVTTSKHPSICGLIDLIHPLLPERWGPGIVPKIVAA